MDKNVDCHSTFLSIILYLLSFYVPVVLSVILPFFIKSIFRFGLDKLYFTVHRIESHVYFFQFQFISIKIVLQWLLFAPSVPHTFDGAVSEQSLRKSLWIDALAILYVKPIKYFESEMQTRLTKQAFFSLWIKHSFLELDFQIVSKVSTLSVCAVDRWVCSSGYSPLIVCVYGWIGLPNTLSWHEPSLKHTL